MLRLTTLVSLLLIFGAPGLSATLAPPSPLSLRIALPSGTDRSLSEERWRSLRGALGAVEEDTDEKRLAQLVPEVYLGNAYQILSWLRQGEIDAAFVSSFAGSLLEQEGTVCRVLQAKPEGAASSRTALSAQIEGRSLDTGQVADLHAFLKNLLHRARALQQHATETSGSRGTDTAPGDEGSRWDSALVYFESHLSSKSFITPLLYVSDWLQTELDKRSLVTDFDRRRTEQHFWTAFLERARFNDGEPRGLEPPGRRFYFNGGGSASSVLAGSDRQPSSPQGFERLSLQSWQYPPPDVLVLSLSALERLKTFLPSLEGAPREACSSLADLLSRVALGTSLTGLPKGNDDIHGEHWRTAQSLFRRTEDLTRRRTEWYDEGRFQFAISDLIGFLHSHQQLSGHRELSVVLPGGGVKSAYQAQVLDELYERYLVNGRGKGDGAGGKLEVRNLVGTSGGAMMSLLAARIGPGTAPSLTKIWDDNLSSSSNVFPFFGLLRWASFLVLAALFGFLLTVSSFFRAWPVPQKKNKVEEEPGLIGRLILGLVAILMGPALLLLDPRLVEGTRLWLPALGYCLLLAAIFLSLGAPWDRARSSRRSVENRKVRAAAEIGLVLAGGVTLALVTSGLPKPWNLLEPIIPKSLEDIHASILMFSYLTLVVCGIILLSRADILDVKRSLRNSLSALLCVAGYVFVCYLVLWILAAAGPGTFFELTFHFWLLLLVTGILVFVALWIALALPGERLSAVKDALSYLNSPMNRGPINATPKAALMTVITLGFAWWYICLGHAFYANGRAYNLFDELIAQPQSGQGSEEDPVQCRFSGPDERGELVELATSIVVTATALEGFPCEGKTSPAGDAYAAFCFDEDEYCRQERGERWHWIENPHRCDVVDAVFASGSPFPVFPARKVLLGEDCSAELVDGGFAHLVPLEGAKRAGARQVLVVRSQPDPLPRSFLDGDGKYQFPSRLTLFAARILPFLFERSQELDRSVAREMFVAEVTPSHRHGEFPILTDFRRKVVDRMITAAKADLSYPVGRVVSWGPPLLSRASSPASATQRE